MTNLKKILHFITLFLRISGKPSPVKTKPLASALPLPRLHSVCCFPRFYAVPLWKPGREPTGAVSAPRSVWEAPDTKPQLFPTRKTPRPGAKATPAEALHINT